MTVALVPSSLLSSSNWRCRTSLFFFCSFVCVCVVFFQFPVYSLVFPTGHSWVVSPDFLNVLLAVTAGGTKLFVRGAGKQEKS